MMVTRQEAQQEVDRNYEEFKRVLPRLMQSHCGKYALMKSRKVMGCYSTWQDAIEAGTVFIPDGLFSIQEIRVAPYSIYPVRAA